MPQDWNALFFSAIQMQLRQRPTTHTFHLQTFSEQTFSSILSIAMKKAPAALGTNAPRVPVIADKKTKRGRMPVASAPESRAIYLGHLPAGFNTEAPLRSYFSQFGDVTHVRASRSPATGVPRGYAFMEFAEPAAAAVAAQAMNRYPLAGRLITAHVLDSEVAARQRLFEGAGRVSRVIGARQRRSKVHSRQDPLRPKPASVIARRLAARAERDVAAAARRASLGITYVPPPIYTPSGEQIAAFPTAEAAKPEVQHEKISASTALAVAPAPATVAATSSKTKSKRSSPELPPASETAQTHQTAAAEPAPVAGKKRKAAPAPAPATAPAAVEAAATKKAPATAAAAPAPAKRARSAPAPAAAVAAAPVHRGVKSASAPAAATTARRKPTAGKR